MIIANNIQFNKNEFNELKMHIFLKGKLLDDRKIISSFITYRFKCLTHLKSFRSHKR